MEKWGAGAWVPAGVAVAGLFLSELDPEHIGGPLYSGFLCGSVFSAVAGIAAGSVWIARHIEGQSAAALPETQK